MRSEGGLLGQNVYEQREKTSLFCVQRSNLESWRPESAQHCSLLGLLPHG